MARPKSEKPAYCLHKSSGRAFVKIDGHPFYLGTFGTPESRDKYDMLIGEWKARGRTLPAPPPRLSTAAAVTVSKTPIGKTVVEAIESYWAYARAYYRHPDGTATDEPDSIRAAMKVLNKLYGDLPADQFDSLKLEAVRENMIGLGWARKTINDHVGRIRRAFKWLAKKKLVPASVYGECMTVEGLKRGRSAARETEKKRPVPPGLVDAVKPHVSNQVWAMIQLQLHSAARPGEIVKLRVCDIDRSGDPWEYQPIDHKNAYREQDRKIRFGPEAQEVIRPFLMRPDDAFLFSPIEAERDRRAAATQAREESGSTPMTQGNRPGTNRKKKPKRSPGSFYTVDTYRRAVDRGIARAFPVPADLAEPTAEQIEHRPALGTPEARENQEKARKAWRDSHHWHPHRLRHNAGTNIRKKYGLEAAQQVLGVKSLDVAGIYAERNEDLHRKIMREVG